MKKILQALSVVLAAVTAVSCIPKPLPIDDIASLQSKVTVSSQLLPGNALLVLITKSVSALEAG